MLPLADVDLNILRAGAFPHDHSLINHLRGLDKHRTALLRIEDTVGYSLARFKRNERTVPA